MTTGASSWPSPHMAVGIHSPAGVGINSQGHAFLDTAGQLCQAAELEESMASDQPWQAEGCLRPKLLLMVVGTHRQQSPGHWSNFPGNAWPAPLPQFIYTQKTTSLNQVLPQGPQTNLCQVPPTTKYDHQYH